MDLQPPGGGPPCSLPQSAQDYSLPLHVAAIFILLGTSLAGSLLPVAMHLSGRTRGVATAIKLGTFFGIGTILATAFIHMLAPAAESLGNPCLPLFWSASYDAWAFLFATAAIALMHLVDYALKGRYWHQQAEELLQGQEAVCGSGAHVHVHAHRAHGGCHAHHAAIIDALVCKDRDAAGQAAAAAEQAALLEAEEGGDTAAGCASGCCGHDHHHGRSHGHDELAAPLLPKPHAHGTAHACAPASPGSGRRGGSADEGPSSSHAGELQRSCSAFNLKKDASQIVGLYMTEAGIIFHSAMIGLTLGLAEGAAFRTLLAALALHQLFEGFAIGSAAVDSGLSAARAAIMGAAFSATTPLGIALGIAVRASFAPGAVGALLVQGICDATSAGILIYVSLVDLLTPMMTDSPWLRAQPLSVQAAAFCALWAGGGVMAILGRWI